MSMAAIADPSRAKNAQVWKRDELDWYVEPVSATADLLRVERFVGFTWDPACGGGNVCRAFDAAGLLVVGTDVVKRAADIPGWSGTFDFLADDSWLRTAPVQNVVTNPPFFRAKGTEAFIRKALRHATGKVAIFTDVKFLASAGRATGLFAEHCPHRVWIIAKRPSCPPGEYLAAGGKAEGGTADWCWLVWSMAEPAARSYQGGWILPVDAGKAVAA